MKYEVYRDIEVTDDFNLFEFFSTGKNGEILKRVTFSRTEDHRIYNLAFGDVDDAGEINDYVVRWIIFRGSTQERLRLYRMAVGLHFEELSILYEIWALVDGGIVKFCKNMRINAFLIRRKNRNFNI
ncbi:MAG TPA: hypothetical protein VGS79_22315 [Puia sp.]|nr:hypothetical protein [Puia sp.]